MEKINQKPVMEKKTVLLPINLPKGDYCWDYSKNGTCDFFDNEGGTPSCELQPYFFTPKNSKNGVLKDPDCAKLYRSYIIEECIEKVMLKIDVMETFVGG